MAPIMYKRFREKLIEGSTNREINFDRAKIILSSYGVSKKMFPNVIKEMVDLKLIQKINRSKLKIKGRWFK